MTELAAYLATPAHDRYSLPGHDRDCARAMWSQARIGKDPLSTVQVEHLLNIAWRAGATAEHEAMYDGVTEDCRPVFDYAKAVAQTSNVMPDLDHASCHGSAHRPRQRPEGPGPRLWIEAPAAMPPRRRP